MTGGIFLDLFIREASREKAALLSIFTGVGGGGGGGGELKKK